MNRDEMAEKHISLVYMVANKLSNLPIDYDERLSLGMGGLMRAMDGFDESKGMKFSTYAVPIIRNEILKAEVKRKRREGIASMDSMETPLYTGSEGKTVTLEDTIPDPQNIEEMVHQKLVVEEVMNQVDKLNKTQSYAIRHYYGIGCEAKTLREIAEDLGISHQGVNGAVKKGIKKLQKVML